MAHGLHLWVIAFSSLGGIHSQIGIVPGIGRAERDLLWPVPFFDIPLFIGVKLEKKLCPFAI